MERRQGEFVITTDPQRLDLDVIHRELAASYWAAGIPRDVVERAVAHSINFGLLHAERQIGCARVVTDRATFAYLADVFVLDEFRGRGLGKWLVRTIREHPELHGLRRWMLVTRDAHGLYEPLGFRPLAHPERVMEIHDPSIYDRRREPTPR